MKELSIIVKESYEQLPTLPGFYRKLDDLLASVNAELINDSQNQIDEECLCEVLQQEFKAKIEREYKRGEDVFSAVRLVLPHSNPNLSDEDIESMRQKVSTILFTKMQNCDGWFEMVKIAPILKMNGIDFKALGFLRLSDFLQTVFDEEFKCEERGDSMHPNIKYVFIGAEKYIEEGTMPYKVEIQETKPTVNKNITTKWKKPSAFDKLMNFAIFPNKGEVNGFNYAIRQLAEEKVLKENWYYGDPENDLGTYPILKNYLLLTFERLLAEDEEHSNDPNWKKKILTTEKNAVFNTGLVDKLYEPVYALFNRNLNERQTRKWVFWTFVKSNDREHQILTRIFGTNLPTPAHYYNSTSELVYNIKKEIGSYNWDHFIDHCERLPLEFLRDNGPKFEYDQPKGIRFYRKLAEAIKEDPRSMNRIKNRIIDAIEYAIKRVRWNFKTAIPIYYPGQKQISLLLPLALVDEDNIDAALVLEATDSGAYIAHTILTLGMAYTNARLITRPDSDWLMAEKITVNEDEE